VTISDELPLSKPIPAGMRAADAIAKNPEKSDRAIAAEIGVDHKTVAKARKSVGENSPPQRSGESSGENSRLQRDAEPSVRDGAAVLCPGQAEVCAGFDADGNLILRQHDDYPDDDSVIIVRAENVMSFIGRLTDICGIPTLRG